MSDTNTLGPATGLTAIKVGTTYVTLSWQMPSNGTPPFQCQVNYRQSGTPAWIPFGQAGNYTVMTVTGLQPGTVYDFDVVTTGVTAVLPAPPGPVNNLAAGTVTSSSIPMTWQAPSSGTPPYGYTVQLKLSTDIVYGVLATNTASLTYTAASLKSGTSYDFQVAAVDSYSQQGSWTTLTGISTLAVVTPPPPPTPPGAVTNIALNTSVTGNPGTNNISIQWSPPLTGVGPFTYDYAFCQVGGPYNSPTRVTTAAASATGLNPSTGYQFEIRAIDVNGVIGSWTVSQTFTTAAPVVVAPTGAVTNFTATPSVSSILLSWGAPTTGSAPFTYVVAYRPHAIGGFSPPISVAATSYTLTDLSGSYDLEVQAKDSTGVSGPQATLNGIATVTPPGSVQSLSVNSAGTSSTAVQLQWSAPTTGTGPFTYSVAYKLDTSGTFSTPVTGISSTTYTFAGLTASTAYDFEVRAVDASGNPGSWTPYGPYTTASASTGPAPGNVNNLVISRVGNNPSDTSIEISWTAPTTGAGSYSYNLAYGPNGTLTQLIQNLSVIDYRITGLSPSTNYIFSVSASDAYNKTGPSTSVSANTCQSLPSGAQAYTWVGIFMPIIHLGSTNSFEVYYDANPTKGITAAQAQSLSSNILSSVDNIYSTLAALFNFYATINNNYPTIEDPYGVKVHVILTNTELSSGASHPTCKQSDIIVNGSSYSDATYINALICAELDESFMAYLKGLPYCDYWSVGEGLSLLLAKTMFPGADMLSGYLADWLNLSPRPDWVNRNAPYGSGTTSDTGPGCGCAILFFSWLRHQGNTYQTIFRAMNNITPTSGGSVPSCTCRDIFNQLTGGTSFDPFPGFAAAVAAIYPVGTNGAGASYDPWNTPVTYGNPTGNVPPS